MDASREFEQSTNQNRLREENIDKIITTYRDRKTKEKYSHLASFSEIEENAFNLNIPRYVDTFEPEPEIDIVAVQKEIEEIEVQLKATRKKMDVYLKELGFMA
jgi:type I restriction enzyme M protein